MVEFLLTSSGILPAGFCSSLCLLQSMKSQVQIRLSPPVSHHLWPSEQVRVSMMERCWAKNGPQGSGTIVNMVFGTGLTPSPQTTAGSMLVSYLSRLSLKVHVLSGGNLPLIAVLVGWEELQGQVGACRYKSLETKDKESGCIILASGLLDPKVQRTKVWFWSVQPQRSSRTKKVPLNSTPPRKRVLCSVISPEETGGEPREEPGHAGVTGDARRSSRRAATRVQGQGRLDVLTRLMPGN